MIFSMRPGQVFRKHCLIALRRLEFFGLKFASLRYCSSSGLVVFNRFFICHNFFFFVSGGTSHIPVCVLLVPFIICCIFLTEISYLSSVMVNT